ncbi:MAG: hypothetical protein V4619_19310 [Bacteroidota bacterium]
MNEQVNTAEYEFLWKLLANPADPNHSYIFNLQSLVSDYPQSGVLRALLMPNGDKKHLKHAAAYFNPRTLHKLATAPDSLAKVSQDQIVFSDEPEAVVADAYFNLPVTETFVPPVIEETEAAYTPVVDDSVEEITPAEIIEPEAEASYNGYNTFSEPEQPQYVEPIVEPSRENIPAYIDEEAEPEHAAISYAEEIPAYIEEEVEAFTPASETNTGTAIEEEFIHDEIAEAPIVEHIEAAQPEVIEAVPEEIYNPVIEEEPEQSLAQQYDTYVAESEAAPTEPVSSYEETGDRYFHQPIEDDVYDEIVSIEDIGLEQLAILNKSVQDGDESYFIFEPEITESEQAVSEAAAPVAETLVTEPVYQAAAAQPVAQTELPAVITNVAHAQQGHGFDAKKDMSMYHDEKMPYSFMWWLDKTRKQHADVYQPYAKQAAPAQAPAPAPKTATPMPPPIDELQKQYYQNIVSTTAFTDLDKVASKAAAAGSIRREDKIIERFIHDEPQIKHPAGVKLDNENKAKNSSEDKEELVTETLARIYTEQMLYHKAVLTYKKLMLKYPEKSLYFAGQIEQLENKIN